MKRINILFVVVICILLSSCQDRGSCSKDAISTLDERFKIYIPPKFPYFQKNCHISDIVVEYDSQDCCALSFTAKGQRFCYYYYVLNKIHYDSMDKTEAGTLIKEAKILYQSIKGVGFELKCNEDEYLRTYIFDIVKNCENPF